MYTRFLAGEEVEIYPQRGTNAVPVAFDPRTRLVYASTWEIHGRQYVSALSGLGGGLARRFAAATVPTGGSVWTFALMPE